MKKIYTIFINIMAVCIIILTYLNQYRSILNDFNKEAVAKESALDRHIDISSGLLEMLKIYGNEYVTKEQEDSPYFSYLVYDKKRNIFHLDAAEGTGLQHKIGNLTGTGTIPSAGISHREINFALQLNDYFQKIHELVPDIAWLYYTSDHDFISIFPWISSEDFIYSSDLKKANFFFYADPENNPEKNSVWTPAYIDYAGKGLMVTYSSPIYYQSQFLGVISLDYTCSYLNKIIKSEYNGYLVDQNGSIIASADKELEDEIITIKNVLHINDINMVQLNSLQTDRVHNFMGYYIYRAEFLNAPWIMYFRIPVRKVMFDAFVMTLPALAICILLILTIAENNRRKRTQTLLSNSLEELKNYQKRLEYSAKYDFLTEILNRRGMEEYLKDELLKQDLRPIIFAMGDLDFFKKLNDTYGHEAGDLVLMECAKVLKSKIKNEDLICRWGGEEFLIMLKGKNREDAWKIAEDIRNDIEAIRVPYKNDAELSVTITIGLAEYEKEYPFFQSIANADNALYDGKRTGRNKVVLFWENEKII